MVPLDRYGRPARWFHRVGWWFARLLVLPYPLSSSGMDRLPRRGPVVVIGPHLSFSDSFPFLFATLPRPVRFFSSAFFVTLNLLMSWALHVGGVIPVRKSRPDPHAVLKALRLLRNGELLAFFPSGDRGWDGTPNAPSRPALKLLARLRVPVYIAGYEGSYDHWPRWDPDPRWRPVRVRLVGRLRLPPDVVQGARRRSLRGRRRVDRWWDGVWTSGGRVDLARTERIVAEALARVARGEAERLDLGRKGRLAAVPRLLCACPACAGARPAEQDGRLRCPACDAGWRPAPRGRLAPLAGGPAVPLGTLFGRMYLKLRAGVRARGWAHREPVEARVVRHQDGGGGEAPFVRGEARLSRDAVLITAGARCWRFTVAAVAGSELEGSEVIALNLPGGAGLQVRSAAGILGLALRARALAGWRRPFSRG